MIPLLWPLAALIAGILLSPHLDSRPVWVCLPITILIGCLRPWGFLLSLILLGAGLRSLEPPVPPDPGDEAVRLTGRLSKAPEWRGLGVYLDLELLSVDEQPYRGRARLTEFLDDPELRARFDALDLGSGDHLEILAKLQRPVVYRNPGGFDYRTHLERQGIYWTGNIRNPRLITVRKVGWHGFDRIRNWISRRLETAFAADPDAQGLIMGMVLGRKYGISARTERLFQAGGLYHLVVVSGFNLAVIAGLALWTVKRLPCKRRTRLFFVLAATLGYAALVEGQTPVTRATLMVVFLIAGRLLDRGYSPGNTIAGTAMLILLVDPASLEDSSFQMTFAAVIAVVGVGMPAVKWTLGWLSEALTRFDDVERDGRLAPVIADWRVSRRLWCELHGLPVRVVTVAFRAMLALGEIAIVSLCVEIVFVVFMVESFHQVSPVSPLLNIPGALVAAAVTPLGLAVILLPEPLAGIAAAVATELLRGLSALLDRVLRLPGMILHVPSAPLWIWVVYALCVAAMIGAIRRRRLRTLWMSGAAVLALQLVVVRADLAPPPPREVTLTFIDVGQGDSTLIEFPNGQRMLIDGGGVAAGRFLSLRNESTFSIGESVVSPFLFSKGFRRLDIVVLTQHAHHDHIDGLFAVMENFEIGELWLGRNPMVPAYRRLIQRAMEKQIPIRWAVAGDVIAVDSSSFTVLHPPANWQTRKTAENDDSLVLLLETGRSTALLTGDIERTIPAPDQVDVLKVSRHGSRGVRLKVGSRVRVISVGANNPFGHPHPSTPPALRTDRLGAITVTMSRPVKVSTYLHGP